MIRRRDPGRPPARRVAGRARARRSVDPDECRRRDEERQRRFVDDAAHELRTPIAAIAGYVELYQAGALPVGPALDRAMDRVAEASGRASKLVDDLVALSRLGREIGSSSAEVDLAAVVVALAEDVRAATGRDVRADTAGPVLLRADPVWLRQALDNLVTNAVAYGPRDRPVEVILRGAGRGATLAVVDHGPGIPEADRERVFERFARLDAGRRAVPGGAGLGLAIVREIVDAHRGEITVGETPGGGASVVIRLPDRRAG